MSDDNKIKAVANIVSVQGDVDIIVNGGSSRTSSSHEILSKQLQTDENNYVGVLETSQGSAATKQMSNKEKFTLKMIENFVGFWSLLSHSLLGTVQWGQEETANFPKVPTIPPRKNGTYLQCSDQSVHYPGEWFLYSLTLSSHRNGSVVWIWGWELQKTGTFKAHENLDSPWCLGVRDHRKRNTIEHLRPEKKLRGDT